MPLGVGPDRNRHGPTRPVILVTIPPPASACGTTRPATGSFRFVSGNTCHRPAPRCHASRACGVSQGASAPRTAVSGLHGMRLTADTAVAPGREGSSARRWAWQWTKLDATG